MRTFSLAGCGLRYSAGLHNLARHAWAPSSTRKTGGLRGRGKNACFVFWVRARQTAAPARREPARRGVATECVHGRPARMFSFRARKIRHLHHVGGYPCGRKRMRKAVPLDCFHFADRVPGKTGGGTLHLCVAAGAGRPWKHQHPRAFRFSRADEAKNAARTVFAALSCMAAARAIINRYQAAKPVSPFRREKVRRGNHA